MKARSVRIMVEDYTTDYVRDAAHMYSGCHYEEDLPSEIIAKLYDILVITFDGHLQLVLHADAGICIAKRPECESSHGIKEEAGICIDV